MPATPASIHPDLQRVLAQFDSPCAIIGSAARDYDSANDIDVLFLIDDIDWQSMMRRLKLKYNGWNHPDGYHVRRANYRLPGISKNIQLITMSHLEEFSDYPYCCLLPDGTRLKEGIYFRKEPTRSENPPLRPFL